MPDTMPDAFARNPVVDALRADNELIYNIARREGPAPGLFGRSDLPKFTASGNSPQALLDLPWNLRHAAAKADQSEWARLHNEYGKANWEPGMEILVGHEPGAHDRANSEYRGRVQAWVQGRAR